MIFLYFLYSDDYIAPPEKPTTAKQDGSGFIMISFQYRLWLIIVIKLSARGGSASLRLIIKVDSDAESPRPF